ncbi:TetR/AcrR family transcriptional regulator [Streptomyces sp. NPDC001985]|uniref:TetR/AcrR family transcriptional regulator n=1 Tax=Streptomyces sp. NPDC001985 TaxID=3154406 RepID=UPI00333483B8
MTEETHRPPRADAERSRRLLLETAGRMFAERGAPVPLNQIAREAGLGAGTAHRRFPELQALIAALFTERSAAFLCLAGEAGRPGRADGTPRPAGGFGGPAAAPAPAVTARDRSTGKPGP